MSEKSGLPSETLAPWRSLEPMAVDHLELRGKPQNRTEYQRSRQAEWTAALINP